jgi:hypothetical protein
VYVHSFIVSWSPPTIPITDVACVWASLDAAKKRRLNTNACCTRTYTHEAISTAAVRCFRTRCPTVYDIAPASLSRSTEQDMHVVLSFSCNTQTQQPECGSARHRHQPAHHCICMHANNNYLLRGLNLSRLESYVAMCDHSSRRAEGCCKDS